MMIRVPIATLNGPVRLGDMVQLRETLPIDQGDWWQNGVMAIASGSIPPHCDVVTHYVVVGLSEMHADLCLA